MMTTEQLARTMILAIEDGNANGIVILTNLIQSREDAERIWKLVTEARGIA